MFDVTFGAVLNPLVAVLFVFHPKKSYPSFSAVCVISALFP